MSVGIQRNPGKNAPKTDARHISNQKFGIIGFLKKQSRNTRQQITTLAEMMNAKSIWQERGKAEYSQDCTWLYEKNRSKKSKNGQTANRNTGRYVFHLNAADAF